MNTARANMRGMNPYLNARDLADTSVDSNLSKMFLLDGQRMIFLGAWTAGGPEGATSLANVPSFDESATADELERKDVRRANGLVLTSPRQVFDIFTAARTELLDAQRPVIKLSGEGYSAEAIAHAQANAIDRSFAKLGGLADQLAAVQDRCEGVQAETRRAFPATDESEAAKLLYDSAIIGRILPLDAAAWATLRQGVLPPGIDARAVEALARSRVL